jgi:hypothetical protein
MAMPAAASQEPRGDAAAAIAVLRQHFGERLQTGAEIRRQHANVITWIPNQPPDAVIWVESTDEVRQVVDVARTYRVPIVPFGAGTSLEGHINAPREGAGSDVEAEKAGVRYTFVGLDDVSWSDRPVPKAAPRRGERSNPLSTPFTRVWSQVRVSPRHTRDEGAPGRYQGRAARAPAHACPRVRWGGVSAPVSAPVKPARSRW